MNNINEYAIVLTFKNQNGSNLILKIRWNKNKEVEFYKFKTNKDIKLVAFSFKYVFILWDNKTLQILRDT